MKAGERQPVLIFHIGFHGTAPNAKSEYLTAKTHATAVFTHRVSHNLQRKIEA